MERVAVFVDVQNVYYTVRQQFNSHFDYNAFFAEVTGGKKPVAAIAYATDRSDSRQRHFQNILRAIGFTVKLTPYITRKDGSAKGDWDVGITVDMLEHASRVDTMVLASGDGDYAPVVTRMREQHAVEVVVYGVKQLTAASLVRAATTFVAIEGTLVMPIP
ncbi:MAG: NYN domain-containing protein [Chitinivibrionales bacterium]|nr:NYN domain-containing protein [Chitinivibrionales bacterium]MBD3394582.1 NYN domain-containing protein [Chitinivibrionales bacterium]